MKCNSISVVIPAYNHQLYIKDAVMSVLQQTMLPLEIIIVDDGSADKTAKVCRDLAKKYNDIVLIEQDNHGAHSALNRAIEAAKGEYISVLNSDDVFAPEKIESCAQLIDSKPGVDFIVHSVEFIDDCGSQLTDGKVIDWYTRALDFYRQSQMLPLSLLNENFVVTTSNMVFSKKIWHEASGFQPLRYCHDLEFLLESIKLSSAFYFHEEPFVRYRVHPRNTIKENMRRVRVEIAAVTAYNLVHGDLQLVAKDTDFSMGFFWSFVKNKKISDLVLFFIPLYLSMNDKTHFFESLSSDQIKDKYSIFFEKRGRICFSS